VSGIAIGRHLLMRIPERTRRALWGGIALLGLAGLEALTGSFGGATLRVD